MEMSSCSCSCSSCIVPLIPCTITSNKYPPPSLFFFFSSTATSIRFRCCGSISSNSWNSNAESSNFKGRRFQFKDEDPTNFGFNNQKKRSRNWWSEEEKEDDDDYDNGGGGGPVLEEAIDSIWIFKVFKTYGWTLPVIILSMLLATGPKAFFMALALPLGQSALFYAIDKVFGRTRDRPKTRSRTKRKPFARASSSVEIDEEIMDGRSGTSEERGGYRSWMSNAAEDSVKKKGGGQRMPSFGGWEELDTQPEYNKDRKRKTTQGQSIEKGKLSRRRRQKDTPLLLRLLIAVFPFLGSWTRLI